MRTVLEHKAAIRSTSDKSFNDIPLLSKEGSRAAAGWSVQSTAKRLLINAREALLINRYWSSLNRPPQPSQREGIPA